MSIKKKQDGKNCKSCKHFFSQSCPLYTLMEVTDGLGFDDYYCDKYIVKKADWIKQIRFCKE